MCIRDSLSASGIPQVTVVHGSSTAGGAYLPGLSDYVVMVEDHAKVFLAGAPLVKAALGEDADEEDLGGARMHATISGTAEYIAADDAHGLHLAREILDGLGWDAVESSGPVEPPVHDPEELCGAIPADTRKPYDIREVVARTVDGLSLIHISEPTRPY